MLVLLFLSLEAKLEANVLPGVKKILFLGDSITYSGQYVEYFDFILHSKYPGRKFEIVDAGLPSETACGLSEPNHAGGAFPRPNVQDRLVRALELVKPDLVVACYGMNDGIYYPFDDERFKAYRTGILLLKKRVSDAHARLILLTPPVFDPTPIRSACLPEGAPAYGSDHPYLRYDETLQTYSRWLLGIRGKDVTVIDIHSPMLNFLQTKRKEDPNFILASDGVHLNDAGHWRIALQLLKSLKVSMKDASFEETMSELSIASPAETFKLTQQRQRLLKDAWLTHIGHKRPGMSTGLPLEEANRQANQITAQIEALQNPK